MSTHLEVLRVREPCSKDWNAMPGEDRQRFCSGCQKHVHNLSAMTREEAEQLICRSAGELCVRYQPAPAGGPVLLSYAPRFSRRGWMFWTGIGMIGAAFAGASQLLLKPPPAPAPAPVATTAPVQNDFVMGVVMLSTDDLPPKK